MSAPSFVRAVIDGVRARLPKRLGPYRTTTTSYLGKLWTGNRDLHYEVWRRPRLGVVELGLHFEADPLTNARLLGAFRAREAEIREALGEAPLLEAWDRGWARFYETRPLQDAPDACAARLAVYVRTLEPILREELPADVAWRPQG
jgi:hypothetical protein